VLSAKPGGLLSFLGRGLPDRVVRGHFPVRLINWNPQPSRLPPGGTGSGQPPDATLSWVGRSIMHRADLLKPDLLSEIVLLVVGTLVFVSLLLIVVTALTRI
jgi:hypothetical protein